MIAEEVSKISGENPFACFQCGDCTGSCPVSFAMDYGPRRMIHLIQLNLEEEVLKANTHWLCASCYNCTYRCPRNISFTRISYALRNISVKRGIYPNKTTKIFYEIFLDHMLKYGRFNEGIFVREFVAKGGKGLKELLRDINLGLKLWKKGKIPKDVDKIDKLDQIKKIYEACVKEEKEDKQ